MGLPHNTLICNSIHLSNKLSLSWVQVDLTSLCPALPDEEQGKKNTFNKIAESNYITFIA